MSEPTPSELFDKFYGCLAGLAVGDAMGMPTSFLTPSQIQRQYGRIVGFESPAGDHIYHAGYRPGQVTDDTEQTLAVLDAILEDQGRVVAQTIVRHLLAWVESVGGPTSEALGPSSSRAFTRIQNGVPLEEAGERGDTNGAAMRISPVGLLHARGAEEISDVVADVALVCLPTHNTNLAISGAAAVACGIAAACRPSRDVDAVIQAALAGAEEGASCGNEVIGPSVARRIELATEIVEQAGSKADVVGDLYDILGAGVATAESVPAALGLFTLVEGDLREGVLEAANMGGDCDTVASMVGALCGAYGGVDGVPAEWLERVETVNDLQLEEYARSIADLIASDNGRSEQGVR